MTKQRCPIFHYFVTLINIDNGATYSAEVLTQSKKEALDKIQDLYPMAKKGNNFCLNEDVKQLPVTHQTLLRELTLRQCFSFPHPKADEELPDYITAAKAFVTAKLNKIPQQIFREEAIEAMD